MEVALKSFTTSVEDQAGQNAQIAGLIREQINNSRVESKTQVRTVSS